MPRAGGDIGDEGGPPGVHLGVGEGWEEGGEGVVDEDGGGVDVDYAVDDGLEVGGGGGEDVGSWGEGRVGHCGAVSLVGSQVRECFWDVGFVVGKGEKVV